MRRLFVPVRPYPVPMISRAAMAGVEAVRIRRRPAVASILGMIFELKSIMIMIDLLIVHSVYDVIFLWREIFHTDSFACKIA